MLQKNQGAVINDGVDTGELAEQANQYGDQKRPAESWIEDVPTLLCNGGADGTDLGLCRIRAIDTGKELLRLSLAAILHQPARAFRNKQQRQQKKHGWYCGGSEHPTPVRRASSREAVVHAVRQQDPADDRQLVHADQQPAYSSGRNLGNVKRRKGGGQSDGQASDHACNYELSEIAGTPG